MASSNTQDRTYVSNKWLINDLMTEVKGNLGSLTYFYYLFDRRNFDGFGSSVESHRLHYLSNGEVREEEDYYCYEHFDRFG